MRSQRPRKRNYYVSHLIALRTEKAARQIASVPNSELEVMKIKSGLKKAGSSFSWPSLIRPMAFIGPERNGTEGASAKEPRRRRRNTAAGKMPPAIKRLDLHGGARGRGGRRASASVDTDGTAARIYKAANRLIGEQPVD